MHQDRNNAGEHVIAIISEAQRSRINLDLDKLNQIFYTSTNVEADNAFEYQHGIFSALLLHELTHLCSIGIIDIKKNKSNNYFILTPNYERIIESHFNLNWDNILVCRNELRASLYTNRSQNDLGHIINRNINRFDYSGRTKWNDKHIRNAFRHYNTALLWTNRLDKKGKIYLDLIDISQKANNRSLLMKCYKSAIDFFEDNRSVKQVNSNLSRQMNHILTFLFKYYKALTESNREKEIKKEYFEEALIDFNKFSRMFNFDAFQHMANENIENYHIFDTLYHDVGKCMYSSQWISTDVIDNLFRNDQFKLNENIKYFPSLFEFYILINIQASICAYLSDDQENALFIIDISNALLNDTKNNPINKLLQYLTTSYKKDEIQKKPRLPNNNVLNKFDTDIRKGTELITITHKENEFTDLLTSNFEMNNDEAKKILNMLDEMIAENSTIDI